MERILKELDQGNGQSVGRLHREYFESELDRRSFERLLDALVRAGFMTEEEDSFDADGRTIEFRRAFLTRAGRSASADALASARIAPEPVAPARKRRATTARKAGSRKRRSTSTAKSAKPDLAPEASASPVLVQALQDWRLQEARRRRTPAFRILSNRTLLGIASEIPRDEESLLAIHGMGPTLVRKFGDQILAIVNRH
jgi:DNA topoisomerase-3